MANPQLVVANSSSSLIRANLATVQALVLEYANSQQTQFAFMNNKMQNLREFWNESGFRAYIRLIGDPRNNQMLTDGELQNYARHLNIQVESYAPRRDREYNIIKPITMQLVRHQRPENPLFSLRLANYGIHWQYQAPYLSDHEVQRRQEEYLKDNAPASKPLLPAFNKLLQEQKAMVDAVINDPTFEPEQVAQIVELAANAEEAQDVDTMKALLDAFKQRK